jgi:RNA binding exosome subunit
LSSKVPIAYIDIRVFAHATEDLDKVLAAVRNILPQEIIDTIDFSKTNLAGHHGNPIILFEARITDKNATQKVFEKLASGLSMLDKVQLSSEIMQHLDKGNLFIRINKQSAYLNEFKLATEDPIHFRIHFKKPTKEDIMDVCKRFGLLP